MALGDSLEEDLRLPLVTGRRLQLGRRYCRRTLQNSDPAGSISSGLHVRGEETLRPARRRTIKVTVNGLDEIQSQVLRILLHGLMMTLRTASTNAPSVRVRWPETRGSGLAKPAGRCSILPVFGNGPRTRDLRSPDSNYRTVTYRHQDNGGVRAVTYRRMFSHLHISVGARRRSIRDRFRVYHRIHVVKRAPSLD